RTRPSRLSFSRLRRKSLRRSRRRPGLPPPRRSRLPRRRRGKVKARPWPAYATCRCLCRPSWPLPLLLCSPHWAFSSRARRLPASASSVQIRSLKSLAIVPKEYHYEMPFEIQADGPYFNVLDFFGRLGRLSRIINVGDLAFDAPENSKGTKFPVHPGTTVSGTFT